MVSLPRLPVAFATALVVLLPRASSTADPGVGPLAEIGTLLVDNLADEEVRTVEVVEFPALNGSRSELGLLLRAEVIAGLSRSQRLEVADRGNLEAALAEQEFQLQDIVDRRDAASQVGRILGVDALAIGEYQDLGTEVRVWARMISVATTEVIASAELTVPRTDQMAHLLGRATAGPAAPPGTLWELDFSNLEEGDPATKLGSNLYALAWSGGMSLGGMPGGPTHPVLEQRVSLPKTVDLELDVLRNGGGHWAGLEVLLVGQDGRAHPVRLNTMCSGNFGYLARFPLVPDGEHRMQRPNQATCTGETPGRLRLRLDGRAVKVFLDDEFGFTTQRPTDSPIGRVRITLHHDVYRIARLSAHTP